MPPQKSVLINPGPGIRAKDLPFFKAIERIINETADKLQKKNPNLSREDALFRAQELYEKRTIPEFSSKPKIGEEVIIPLAQSDINKVDRNGEEM